MSVPVPADVASSPGLLHQQRHPRGHGDKNVQIDYIEIDGTRYQSEDPANTSLGSWTRSNGCALGAKSSEILHCNGWIEYAGARAPVR